MKKLILFVVVFFSFIDVCAAKGIATVASGDGTKIGDEICIGTECFYVLENDGHNIRMLSKYNLDVGIIYSGEKYSDANECRSKYEDYLYHEEDNTYIGIEYIDAPVLQNKLAIGAHGSVSGQPEFPEYGVYILNYVDFIDYLNGNYSEDKIYDDGYFDVEFDSGSVLDYLDSYSNNISDMGVDVSNSTILSVKEISLLVEKITGQKLPLSLWYKNGWTKKDDPLHENIYLVGSISDQIPVDLRAKYSWIWGTTYWTNTISKINQDEQNYHNYYMLYFVDTLGNLCSGSTCPGAVGAGIRPVITISSDEIYYVYTKTDGNGMITYQRVVNGDGVEEVEFSITPKDGYVLDHVVVTDSNNKEIVFTDYKFRMPSSDVTIYAKFRKMTNPATNAMVLAAILIIFICSIGTYLVIRRKKNLN